MSEIVKICKNHGELTVDQVKFRADKNSYICKQCLSEYEKRRKRPEGHYENYVKEKSREWRQKNSDLVNERVKQDRQNNLERYRDYDRTKRNKDLEKSRYNDVLKKHKITSGEYLGMIDYHNNLCAICNKEETRKSRTEGNICRLVIDHCHKCEDNGYKGMDTIRGLLCHACNAGIGYFLDDINLLENAINYLQQHKHIE